MSENIYKITGFASPNRIIYTKKTINQAKELFQKTPLSDFKIAPLIVEKNISEQAYAISTAENEKLTKEEAEKIIISPEIKRRLNKYRNDKKMSIEEKYEKLEFENVKNVEINFDSISFKEVDLNLILKLHYELTIGLDEYAKDYGVNKYKPGELRTSDNIKVGGRTKQYKPIEAKKIKHALTVLIKEFSQRENINLIDIIEFHILFYAIHPFQNGNKRIIRVIESMLLNHYSYSANRTISLSIYYKENQDTYHFYLLESLRKKNPNFFINFALRGYFTIGKETVIYSAIFHRINRINSIKQYLNNIITTSKKQEYMDSLDTISDLSITFKHKEFMEKMKNKKYKQSKSAELLKYLLKSKFIYKLGTEYTLFNSKTLSSALNHHTILEKFYLENEIII